MHMVIAPHSLWNLLPFFAAISLIWISCWDSSHYISMTGIWEEVGSEENTFPEVTTFCIPQTPSCQRNVFLAACTRTNQFCGEEEEGADTG